MRQWNEEHRSFLNVANNPHCLQNRLSFLFSKFVYPLLSGHVLKGRLRRLSSPWEGLLIRVSQWWRFYPGALLSDWVCAWVCGVVWPSSLESSFHCKKGAQLVGIPLLPLKRIISELHGYFSSHLRTLEGASLQGQPVQNACQSREMDTSNGAVNLSALGRPKLWALWYETWSMLWLFKPLVVAFSGICNQMPPNWYTYPRELEMSEGEWESKTLQ